MGKTVLVCIRRLMLLTKKSRQLDWTPFVFVTRRASRAKLDTWVEGKENYNVVVVVVAVVLAVLLSIRKPISNPGSALAYSPLITPSAGAFSI